MASAEFALQICLVVASIRVYKNLISYQHLKIRIWAQDQISGFSGKIESSGTIRPEFLPSNSWFELFAHSLYGAAYILFTFLETGSH